MSRKQKFSDKELWEIASKHKEAFTSVEGWNQYAKENGLPHSQTFIQRFGSWNTIKEKLNLDTNNQHRPVKYQINELNSIIREHKEALTSINSWNQYAQRHNLPSYDVFERHLGAEQIEEITQYKTHLTQNDLKKIILSHFPESPPTVSDWKALSETKRVPSFSTIIRKFGSWKEMKRKVYYLERYN